jgi:hypothetical protein
VPNGQVQDLRRSPTGPPVAPPLWSYRDSMKGTRKNEHPSHVYPEQGFADSAWKGMAMRARFEAVDGGSVELVLTQDPDDNVSQRFRVAPLPIGPNHQTFGWAVVDLLEWDGALGGCRFTHSKVDAQRLRAEAARLGGLD